MNTKIVWRLIVWHLVENDMMEDKLGVFTKLGYFLDGERKKEKLHEKTN